VRIFYCGLDRALIERGSGRAFSARLLTGRYPGRRPGLLPLALSPNARALVFMGSREALGWLCAFLGSGFGIVATSGFSSYPRPP
jgi:hypothetical protein